MINPSPCTIKISGEYCKIYQDDKKQSYIGIKINKKNSQYLEYELEGNLDMSKFRKLHSIIDNIAYFHFDKNSQTLDELQFNIRQMQEEKIQSCVEDIMQQILLSLFLLHSQGLMGRVFNYENIVINDKRKVLFYDFGFCTNMPNNPDLDKYDLKLDIWLLGNILYYLIKGKPADFTNGQQIVLITDKKINKDFISLINQMLLNDKEKRIGFIQLIKYLKNIPQQENLIEFYEKRIDEGKIKDRILFRETTSQIISERQDILSDVQLINYEVNQDLKIQIDRLLKYYFTPQQIRDYNDINKNEKIRVNELYDILKKQYDQETKDGKQHLFQILIMLRYIQSPGNQILRGMNSIQQLRDLAIDQNKIFLELV